MPTNDRRRWNRRFLKDGWTTEPSGFLVSLDAVLPHRGRALDVAGGPGPNALWLAERGLDITLLDISDVALDMARRAAEDRRLAVSLIQIDLEVEPIPDGPWNLVVCFNYLHRPLLSTLALVLAPEGLLALELATQRNLERHAAPPREFLLEDEEVVTLIPNLEILQHDEGWWEDRHVAHVLAKRPAD